MMALPGTAGTSIRVASYPPASLKLTTWWQGFSEQQERINSNTGIVQASACATFAHFSLAKASHVAKPGVSEGHSKLHCKGPWVQGEGEFTAMFVLYRIAQQAVLCILSIRIQGYHKNIRLIE